MPIQSGSQNVLTRMNRPYTLELYSDIIRKLRIARPDIQISSDFIVGFPGETDEDFEQTMRIAEQIKYIKYLEYNYPLEKIDPKILMLMKVRQDNPEASLVELIEILDTEYGQKLSKPGLSHRFAKIKELAILLNIPRTQREELAYVLQVLVDEGKVVLSTDLIKTPESFIREGKELRDILEEQLIGVVRNLVKTAGEDIDKLAKLVEAISIKPKLVYKFGWIVKPIFKFLNSSITFEKVQ